MICNDSTYPELASLLAAQGAAALFVPTNNGLPPARGTLELASLARQVDIACAVKHSVYVIRADVAGRTDRLVSYGSSGIVDPTGTLLQSGRPLEADLLVAEIEVSPRLRLGGHRCEQ